MQEARRKRNDIELARVIAALAVVWFHAQGPGHLIVYGGLVLFLMLSPYLAEKSRVRPGMLAQRTQRLLLPWLFWFVVYAVTNVALRHAPIPLEHGWLAGVLGGPAGHLWFMPFIFGVLVVFDLVRPHTTLAMRASACGLAAAAMLVGVGLWRDWSLARGEPVAQYLHALPAVFLGFFFAGLDELPRKASLPIAAAILAGVAVAMPFKGVGLSYAVGIAAFAPLLWGRFDDLEIGPLAAIAPLTLGIYLVHFLFLRCLFKAGLPPGGCLAALAIALSVLAIWALRRFWPSLAHRVT